MHDVVLRRVGRRCECPDRWWELPGCDVMKMTQLRVVMECKIGKSSGKEEYQWTIFDYVKFNPPVTSSSMEVTDKKISELRFHLLRSQT